MTLTRRPARSAFPKTNLPLLGDKATPAPAASSWDAALSRSAAKDVPAEQEAPSMAAAGWALAFMRGL